MKDLKIKISSAQNVRKVLVSKKEISASFRIISYDFVHGLKNRNVVLVAYLWWSNGVLLTWFGVRCWCHLYVSLSSLCE